MMATLIALSIVVPPAYAAWPWEKAETPQQVPAPLGRLGRC
jgi:hypothetical protein